MTTLNPPLIQKFPENSLERKVYKITEELSNYIPIANDRNRLGFALYKFMTGEGDEPEKLVLTLKLKIEGIKPEELARKISSELEKIKKES